MPSERRHGAAASDTDVPAAADRSPAARRDWQHLSAASDGALKLAALATVGVYVLGMLVTNAYLFRLGLAEFAMVRPRFALVGFTFAALLVAITLPTALAWTLERRTVLARAAVGDRRAWLRAIISWRTALGVLLSFAVLCWVSVSVDDGPLNPLDQAFYKWYVAYVVCLLLFAGAHLLMRRDSPLTDEPLVLVLVGALALLVPFLVYASAVHILPALPEQVGGARPKQVRLLVGADDVAGLRAVGFPFSGQAGLTDSMPMLFDATSLYVLRLEDRRIVHVDKRLIKAVIIEER